MQIESFEQLMRLGAQQPLWRAVLLADCEERQADEAASFERMRAMLRAMRAADDGYAPGERSRSGLVGGDGGRMAAYAASGHTVCGPLVCDVIARALKMGESNACMKRIVAAPTAGACGVLPAVLLSYADARGADEDAAWLPLDDYSRVVDYSRFPTQGQTSNADGINAYVFSERGIFRPGETLRFGMLMRRGDWKALPPDRDFSKKLTGRGSWRATSASQ